MQPINEIVREIVINRDSLVGDLQNEFSACYPFLKLEFIASNNTIKSSRVEYLPPQFAWKQLPGISNYKIDVSNIRTVAELSHQLQQLLPVSVEVSRKSGKVWNKITISNEWTLQSQNDAGEFISSQMKGPVL